MITQDDDQIIGAWGLIDADLVTGDPGQEELDVVFILTKTSYYFARYDDDLDTITDYEQVMMIMMMIVIMIMIMTITDYEQVALEDILKIEFGLPEQTFSLFNKGSRNQHRA